MDRNRRAFTLIELLVVIAIIAIVSIVAVLVLNPASLLQQSRDAGRISDMATLSSVIGFYSAAGGVNLGNANTVYVSLPDPAATSTAGDQCQGLALPLLPTGYKYQCAATSTVRNNDSTGWIPVNFSLVSFGSPLSQLPLDPINQSSSRLYYTYTTNGTQYEVTSPLESSKYKLGGSNDVISSDGALLNSVYVKGSSVTLEPLDYGDASLIGYWPLTEGTGTVAYDDSGTNATGSFQGLPSGASGYFSPGFIGPYAGYFNAAGGSNGNYVGVPVVTIPPQFTLSAWVNAGVLSPNYVRIMETNYTTGFYLGTDSNTTHYQVIINNPSIGSCNGGSVTPGTWQFVAATYNGSNAYLYVNGALVAGPCSFTAPALTTSSMRIGCFTSGGCNVPGGAWKGLIDDVRIYSRVLPSSMIQALYNSQK